jgi:hypothetical protein
MAPNEEKEQQNDPTFSPQLFSWQEPVRSRSGWAVPAAGSEVHEQMVVMMSWGELDGLSSSGIRGIVDGLLSRWGLGSKVVQESF